MHKIYPAIAIGIGIVFLALGLLFLLERWSFIQSAKTATAKITGFESRLDYAYFAKNRKPVYAPAIVFQTEDGQEINCQTSTYFKEGKYVIDEEVEIYYRQKDPQQARLNDFKSLWWLPGSMLAFGVGGLLLGWYYLNKGA